MPWGSNYMKGGGRGSFCRRIVPVAADFTPSTAAAAEAEGLHPEQLEILPRLYKHSFFVVYNSVEMIMEWVPTASGISG